MKWTIPIGLILLTITQIQAQETPLEAPQIAIRVALEQTVEVDGVKITFLEVLEDSRCPKDVTCIWEGRVRVLVGVETPGEPSLEKEMIFGKTLQDEPQETMLIVTENFSLKGLSVVPYPESATGEKDPYALLIRKEVMH